ncbi:MAG: response regulator transcription factor [Acidobacteriota bacterium]
MSSVKRIVLVDDHLVVRTALQQYLESFDDLQVIGEAANGEEALQRMESWQPDIVVMDLMMPGGIDGVETTRRLIQQWPALHIVVLTAHTDDARVVAALRAGAVGYIRKDAAPETFLQAVRGAAEGRTVVDPSVSSTVVEDLARSSPPGAELTPRETDVLRLVASGLTNRQIAERLYIGEETVKTHVGNLLSKLGLSHRTQAAVHALKKGLVTLEELEPSAELGD